MSRENGLSLEEKGLKEEINKEGWDDNAAVIIGKKEGGEIDRLRENLENEGQCADVATYVKLNKQIIVPAEKVPEEVKKQKGKGWMGGDGTVFEFIDKEGNIARVDIDYTKIASIPSNDDLTINANEFTAELREYGFNIVKMIGGDYPGETIARYRDEVREQMKRQKTKEFDF